jgi:hypothetical protein
MPPKIPDFVTHPEAFFTLCCEPYLCVKFHALRVKCRIDEQLWARAYMRGWRVGGIPILLGWWL